jgi:cytochrome P450/NADPH-cytochrome P450 reductase
MMRMRGNDEGHPLVNLNARPAFGPLAIRGMFDEMHDLASQLVVKWARFGEKEVIDVSSDFTRLTLDTIAL